jgi:hypothetical protein
VDDIADGDVRGVPPEWFGYVRRKMECGRIM